MVIHGVNYGQKWHNKYYRPCTYERETYIRKLNFIAY